MMEIRSEAKKTAREILGHLRSEASRKHAENREIDEEEYFRKIAYEFLHSFALEATSIVSWPNGLDVFRSVPFKGDK
jgi:hypothetical protein